MRRRLLPLVLLLTGLGTVATTAAADAAGSERLASRLDRVERQLDALTEDVEDLREPVAELDLFDQCAFTIGMSEHGRRGGPTGYLFGTLRRPALSFDLDGVETPAYDVLAFPQEEPPSIECNEDAGPEQTDG